MGLGESPDGDAGGAGHRTECEGNNNIIWCNVSIVYLTLELAGVAELTVANPTEVE